MVFLVSGVVWSCRRIAAVRSVLVRMGKDGCEMGLRFVEYQVNMMNKYTFSFLHQSQHRENVSETAIIADFQAIPTNSIKGILPR